MSTKKYAFIKDEIVVNIAVFDENVTDETLLLFKNDNQVDDIVLATDKTVIGGTYDGSKFWKLQPYPSWIKSEEFNDWIPPFPHPNDENKYFWNEEDRVWNMMNIEIIEEEESPKKLNL